MANSFSKEERVAFEDLLEGFQDALVLSRNVSVYNTDQTMMERANNTIWRPQPYIAQSINSTPGNSIAGQYQGMTQLAVPATLGYSQTVPWEMTALELRDALQEGRLGESAKQKLASTSTWPSWALPPISALWLFQSQLPLAITMTSPCATPS